MISGAGIGNWGNETYNLQDDYVEKDPNGRYVRVISFYFVYVFILRAKGNVLLEKYLCIT